MMMHHSGMNLFSLVKSVRNLDISSQDVSISCNSSVKTSKRYAAFMTNHFYERKSFGVYYSPDEKSEYASLQQFNPVSFEYEFGFELNVIRIGKKHMLEELLRISKR